MDGWGPSPLTAGSGVSLNLLFFFPLSSFPLSLTVLSPFSTVCSSSCYSAHTERRGVWLVHPVFQQNPGLAWETLQKGTCPESHHSKLPLPLIYLSLSSAHSLPAYVAKARFGRQAGCPVRATAETVLVGAATVPSAVWRPWAGGI